jgi:hypothetical protein
MIVFVIQLMFAQPQVLSYIPFENRNDIFNEENISENSGVVLFPVQIRKKQNTFVLPFICFSTRYYF